MFALHVIMMHISILSKFDHILCRSELWVFYMRFFLSIEVFWDDQNSFICSVAEISRSVYFLTWKIIVVVIFAPNILRNSQSICVKNLREHLFEWLKKSMIWWLYCLLLSISMIWFRTIHSFRYDDWQLTCWQRDRIRIFFAYFIFLLSYIRVDMLLQIVKRDKRRIVAIAIDISNFEILIVAFNNIFHIYIQRSIKSNNNFWKCFWHNSTFHAS